MKWISLPLLLGVLMLASGCAATSGTTQAASQEWRLQSLEESFLDFQEAQRQEAERSRAADAELAKRLARLEERVTAILGTGADLPPEQGDPGGMRMDGDDMRPGGATMAEPGADGMQPAEPRTPAVLSESMREPAPGGDTGMTGALPAPIKAGPESNEEKPWDDVPGPALEAKTRQPASSMSPPAALASRQSSSAASGTSAQTLYEQGLNLVRSGRAEQGRATLERFLKDYPANKLAPNAIYWIGESWYGQKNYPQAILSFKDVVTKYPKHPKSQAALLKIGMSYRNVGDKDNAVFYLRTLVDDHPGSEPAKMAEQLLREIPN
ncbi:tol-pal system protein YbgF [Paucidesulfovibrio longus]|uniref:tol-pal system protein YbgF n=1 Tax=Paucidesulfovibrio longus TaxID=889 RepID=UPI0003B53149|nr:tol-pal system protein YbgF [Paucidesulfovibrio longus]